MEEDKKLFEEIMAKKVYKFYITNGFGWNIVEEGHLIMEKKCCEQRSVLSFPDLHLLQYTINK